ncbi:MAG: SPOR domain-containing protein, partial [Pseudomonadota bacterium]
MHFPGALPGLERRWQSDGKESAWDKLARDASISRLGIHYELDGWGGEVIGQRIAQRTHRSVFTTADNRSQDDLGSFDWIPWPDHLAERGGCDFEQVLEANNPVIPPVGGHQGGNVMTIAYQPPEPEPSVTAEPPAINGKASTTLAHGANGVSVETLEEATLTDQQARYRVQLMAVNDRNHAVTGWNRIRSAAGDTLDGVEHLIEQGPDRSDVFHRLLVGNFDERPEADTLCQRLETRNVDCFVVEQ